jgi:hypothetical protein
MSVGSNNILLGNGATLPVPSGSDQIVLGTDKSSLLIQGSLNYNVDSSPITGIKILVNPLAQFYKIEPTTDFTITLPAAAPSNKGVTVIFRRTNSNMATVTFDSNGGGVYPFNNVAAGTTTLSNSQYQTQFVCNGNAWYQIYAA